MTIKVGGPVKGNSIYGLDTERENFAKTPSYSARAEVILGCHPTAHVTKQQLDDVISRIEALEKKVTL